MNRRWHIRVVLGGYRSALALYPPEFRERYSEEMISCAEQMLLEDESIVSGAFRLASDLLSSLLKENLAMTLRPNVLTSIALLLTLTTFVAGTAYLISQQVLRASANDPQVQMAEDGAQRLTAGEDPAQVIPSRTVNLAGSIAPFMIVYDRDGRPLASSAKLDGTTPVPPRGVFDFVRKNGEERVTWKPREDVRLALVMQRYSGGYVAVGRSLRETETRIALIGKLALVCWLLVNAIALALMFALKHLGETKPRAMSSA